MKSVAKFKFVISGNIVLIATLTILTACNERSDQQLQRELAGTWTLQLTNHPTGGEFKSVTHVSPAGFYTSIITRTGSSNTVYTDEIGGTWFITNAVLVDTMTKHSNTNFPSTSRFVWRERIVRLNEHELVTEPDGTNAWNSPFAKLTFHRTRK